jgi:hypothetical protein
VEETATEGPQSTESFTVKAKIFAIGLVDILIDLLLPTLVYVALAPIGRSEAVRLTIGGFSVAAKSVTGRVHSGAEEAEGASYGRKALQGLAIAVAAAAVTLIVSYAGAGNTWSIGAGTLVLGAGIIPMLLRRRRIDGFALLVLAEVALSVLLVTISSDARFILVRPSFYTAIAGIYAIVTCWTDRPFMMEVSRPMAAGGDARRAAAFDRAWFTSPTFRRTEQIMTFALGIVLIAEAILRVVTVYTQPRDAVVHASLISQLPATILFVGYLAAIRIFAVPIASREVDRELLNESEAR